MQTSSNIYHELGSESPEAIVAGEELGRSAIDAHTDVLSALKSGRSPGAILDGLGGPEKSRLVVGDDMTEKLIALQKYHG